MKDFWKIMYLEYEYILSKPIISNLTGFRQSETFLKMFWSSKTWNFQTFWLNDWRGEITIFLLVCNTPKMFITSISTWKSHYNTSTIKSSGFTDFLCGKNFFFSCIFTFCDIDITKVYKKFFSLGQASVFDVLRYRYRKR